ncbi:MAG: hypothetical protein AAGF55_01740 [Pseudomonadota bacterium]
MSGIDLAAIELETLCRCLGLLGFAVYVGAFLCLSLGTLNSSRPVYFVLVLVASSCVLAGLWVDFNLPAALIQGFYMTMSLGAIAVRWRGLRAGESRQPLGRALDLGIDETLQTDQQPIRHVSP